MKKELFRLLSSRLMLSVFLSTVFFIPVDLSADFRFREFERDRQSFEHYADEAEKSISGQEWQDILDNGRKEMFARWEERADAEAERFIRDGFEESEVRKAFEEARAEWEKKFDYAGAAAKGAWLFNRENLISAGIDFTELKNSVKAAGEEQSINDIGEWDSFVKASLNSINSQWDQKFSIPLGELSDKGALLTSAERSGFEEELAGYEFTLRRQFEVERDTILYSARNRFINEIYTDTQSLRYRSNLKSAESATADVIKDVQSELESEEEKILTRSFTAEGESSIDFSAMGDDWENRLKELISAGVDKWNSALEKLYRDMVQWKETAESAFESAEALWRQAAEKLTEAKLQWESDISREIYDSLNRWESGEENLYRNIETARSDFAGYMENLSSQWNDHSSGLVSMAVDASRVYTGALDNIKWLEEQCGDSAVISTGAFGVKGSATTGNSDFETILEESEISRISSAISSQYDRESIEERYSTIYCYDPNNCFTSSVTYAAHSTGRYRYYTECGEYYCSPDTSRGLTRYTGHFYFDSTKGYYTREYAGAVEDKDGKGNWYLTETYTIRIYGRKYTYKALPETSYISGGSLYANYYWEASDVLLDTFTITNDVTENSADREKSSYYYYKTELARWKDIRESFSGIAAEAESYMHERNMLGEDGPGYLNDAGGNDPYLMTDAEFALEISDKNRDYWLQRLDIAKAVLDYAEAAKRESAPETEARKKSTEKALNEAKTAYETALSGIDSIVAELKTIKGTRPAEMSGPDWESYTASIEYLTGQFSEANAKLAESDREYTELKRALILLENSENADFLAKEIGEIEKRILESEKTIYEKYTELFVKEMESEYSAITSGFAERYLNAVSDYEDSKRRMNSLSSILTEEENDENLQKWGADIIAAKGTLFNEEGEGICEEIHFLITGYNADRREALSSLIRNIYFHFQRDLQSSKLVMDTLRDPEFDPKSFMNDGTPKIHDIYQEYAELSIAALQIVEDAFHWGEEEGKRDYASLVTYLQNGLNGKSFSYGGNNSPYIKQYTALNYFIQDYAELDESGWDNAKEKLERDRYYSEKAADIHEEIADLDDDEKADMVAKMESDASAGDLNAVAWLRENYGIGSGIAGLEFIEEYDRRGKTVSAAHDNLFYHVLENGAFLQSRQHEMKSNNYLLGLFTCINDAVSLTVNLEDNPLSLEAFSSLDPREIALAADALTDYISRLENQEVPVPEYLRNAEFIISGLKGNLEQSLFIQRYMSGEDEGEMEGSVDEIYNRKYSEAEFAKSVSSFVENCADIIDSGKFNDYTSAMNILVLYENLSDDKKNFFRESDDKRIKGVNTFIEELYLRRYTVESTSLAERYAAADPGVTPEQYADYTGTSGITREKLIAAITPAYNRKKFNADMAEGNISDISVYIKGLGLSSEHQTQLMSYAVISEYRKIAGGGTGSDPLFTAYNSSKKFSDLPEAAAIYEASLYYYNEIFSKNGIIKTGLEQFLEDKFGDGIESSVVDAVEKYAARLNAVSLFCSNDYYSYAANLEEEAAEFFLLYVNGTSEAVLPGFDYGIYATDPASASLLSETGRITAAIDGFMSSYTATSTALQNLLLKSESGLQNAAALKQFWNSEGETSWRDIILPVTETAAEQDEETEEITWEENDIIVLTPLSEAGGWFDIFDIDTGLKNNLVVSGEEFTREGKSWKNNDVIDAVNSIRETFDSLGNAMKEGYNEGTAESISGFLSNADALYSLSGSYTTALINLVSGYTTGSDDLGAEFNTISAELEGLSSSVEVLKDTLRSNRESWSLLTENGDKETLEKKLEAARIVHETNREEVESLNRALAEARGRYEEADGRYINRMSLVSESYSTYRALEFEYEKAYSVWEYANTPYLMEEAKAAAEINSGAAIEDGTADYSDIPVPDARDNYQRILAQYNEAERDFNEKSAAVENQETVEKLNADSEYSEIKENFVRTTESFVRISQVFTEVREDLEQFKTDCKNAKAEYERDRDSITFYVNKADTLEEDNETLELEKIRDRLLSHILKTGSKSSENLSMYITGIQNYAASVKLESYNETLAGLTKKYDELKENELYQNLLPSILSEIEKYRDRITSIREYSTAFESLPDEVKRDIREIYTAFNTGEDSDNLQLILDNFPGYAYKKQEYEYANWKYHRTSKYNYFTKRKWKRKRESRRKEMKAFYSKYHESGLEPISKSLENARNSKIRYAEKSEIYSNISSVRYIDDIKAYLKQQKYSLTDEDLARLYDSSVENYTIESETVNLEMLRDETARTDLDGTALDAKIVFDRDSDGNVTGSHIVVLNRDGKETSETYDIDDISVRLKLGGEEVTDFTEGGIYRMFDMTYNIESVLGAMKERVMASRSGYYTSIMDFMNRSSEDGTHDKTVILRDLESTYHTLQHFAVNFNLENSGVTQTEDKEYRQRGLEGYVTITREYVNNGKEVSIQGMIVNGMIAQSTALQNQLWHQQIEKFNERKERWKEVAGYIMNRGMKEWRENWSEFKERWMKWRSDAREMISDGEEWWRGTYSGMKGEMNRWSSETASASSKEAAERIYKDLAIRISKYEADLKKNIPDGTFHLDTEKILTETMRNAPVNNIGMLGLSMLATDTTAGFTAILNMGLSGTLSKHNGNQMADYTSAVTVMKNLQVIDILNGIIEGFNTQLEDANKSIYDGVETNIRNSETFISAPYRRNENSNSWSIRVCIESTLAGKEKYKTRRFTDYGYFQNSTVLLKPVKGLNGKTVDFREAGTYSNIEADELDTYVSLEAEWLNREIEKVFGTGGTFSGHQKKEYKRLGDTFAKYYEDWAAGEALKNSGFYAKPIIPHGPNLMTTAAIAASMTGQVWAAALVAGVTTGLQMADGELSFEHGITQMVVGAAGSMAGAYAGPAGSILVNMAASGIDYEEGGGIGWSKKSFKQGFKGGAVKLAMYAGLEAFGMNGTMTGSIIGSTATGIVTSGVETEGSWFSFGFDTENWSQHMATGIAAGVSKGVVAATENSIYGDMAEQAVMTMGYNIRGGRGFKENMSGYNWNAMMPGAQTLGSLLGEIGGDWYKQQQQPKGQSETAKGDASRMPEETGDPIGAVDNLLSGLWIGLGKGKEFFNEITTAIKGFADDTGITGAVTAAADMVKSGAGGMNSIFEKTDNFFKEGEFASNMDIYEKEYSRLFDLQRTSGLTASSANSLNDSNINTMQDELKEQQKQIADLETKLKKLEKSNPEEAAWLREKVAMMKQGIEVNEIQKIDTTTALNANSLKYYEIKKLMSTNDFEKQNICIDNIHKIQQFKNLFGVEPTRFEFYYQNDPDKLTDPEIYRQDDKKLHDGRGPVSYIVEEVFQSIIDNPNNFKYTGNPDKWTENQFLSLKNNILDNANNLDKLVSNTADGTCFIESLYFISVANGNYNGELKDFMFEGYENGDFGQNKKYDWVNHPENYVGSGKTGVSSNDEINKLAGDNMYAIIKIDRSAAADQPNGTHFSLIGRDGNNWISYDHDDKLRGNKRYLWRNNPVNYSRIRKIFFAH